MILVNNKNCNRREKICLQNLYLCISMYLRCRNFKQSSIVYKDYDIHLSPSLSLKGRNKSLTSKQLLQNLNFLWSKKNWSFKSFAFTALPPAHTNNKRLLAIYLFWCSIFPRISTGTSFKSNKQKSYHHIKCAHKNREKSTQRTYTYTQPQQNMYILVYNFYYNFINRENVGGY